LTHNVLNNAKFVGKRGTTAPSTVVGSLVVLQNQQQVSEVSRNIGAAHQVPSLVF
jgi:hypothetical protein